MGFLKFLTKEKGQEGQQAMGTVSSIEHKEKIRGSMADIPPVPPPPGAKPLSQDTLRKSPSIEPPRQAPRHVDDLDIPPPPPPEGSELEGLDMEDMGDMQKNISERPEADVHEVPEHLEELDIPSPSETMELPAEKEMISAPAEKLEKAEETESADIPDDIPELEEGLEIPDPVAKQTSMPMPKMAGEVAEKTTPQINRPVHQMHIPIEGPIFIDVSDYAQIKSRINDLRNSTKAADERVAKLNEIMHEEDSSFTLWHNCLEEMERKMIYADKVLFESAEEQDNIKPR